MKPRYGYARRWVIGLATLAVVALAVVISPSAQATTGIIGKFKVTNGSDAVTMTNDTGMQLIDFYFVWNSGAKATGEGAVTGTGSTGSPFYTSTGAEGGQGIIEFSGGTWAPGGTITATFPESGWDGKSPMSVYVIANGQTTYSGPFSIPVACQPEDPQGPGELDKCPGGEEVAKRLEVDIVAYDAKTQEEISKVHAGEEVYFVIGIQNPNDDPIKGNLVETVYEHLLPPSEHPIRDEGPGLFNCEAAYPHRAGFDSVRCIVELPKDGYTSFRTYATIKNSSGGGPAHDHVDVEAKQISDGQPVSEQWGISIPY